MSCKEQHEFYLVEQARIEALAKTLGAEAEQCVKLQGAYESAYALNEAAKKCAIDKATYQNKSNVFNIGERDAGLCKSYTRKYEKARLDHNAKVAAVSRSNASLKIAYEQKVATITATNKKNATLYSHAMSGYSGLKYSWDRKMAAYKSYSLSVQGQQRSLDMAWAVTLSKSAYVRGFQWNHKQSRCGKHMRCVTKAWRAANHLKCNPVRGLGALPVADACKLWFYYPTCPDSCPKYVANPGAAPKPPTAKVVLKPAPRPVYAKLPVFTMKKPQADCNVGRLPNPIKTKPTCSATPLTVPANPNCIVPEIPTVPVAPTCDPRSFAGIGPMWLLIAAAAGGVYLIAKK